MNTTGNPLLPVIMDLVCHKTGWDGINSFGKFLPGFFYIRNRSCRRPPIYYSLQHPTMPGLSIKRNDRISANNEIIAIDYILPYFMEAMRSKEGMLKNTIFSQLSELIEFKYFHNVPCGKENILNSDSLQNLDTRFLYSYNNVKGKFCSEGKFLRGCVQISSKK